MEQNFQTSFIPKRPMMPEQVRTSHSLGLFSVIAIFIFLTMLVATGALYLYKGMLGKKIDSRQSALALAKNRFEPSRISQLQVLDKRLKAASEVLNGHITVSPIFKALEAITMKTVRYTKFNYVLGDRNERVEIKLSGLAVGYRSIALQSDLFAKNKNLIDPVFSNLTLDDKGNVLFDLAFSVDPSFVNYRETLKAEAAAPLPLPAPIPPPEPLEVIY